MISGALYHLVATISVMKPWFPQFLPAPPGVYPLARMKSEILISQLAFTRRLLGLRLRCKIFAEWMYLRPQSVWYRKDWKWESVNGCPERIWAKGGGERLRPLDKDKRSNYWRWHEDRLPWILPGSQQVSPVYEWNLTRYAHKYKFRRSSRWVEIQYPRQIDILSARCHNHIVASIERILRQTFEWPRKWRSNLH